MRVFLYLIASQGKGLLMLRKKRTSTKIMPTHTTNDFYLFTIAPDWIF